MSSPRTNPDTTYSVAELSAIHRDLLWVLARTGPCESHLLHQALTDYYSESINHSQVCDALEALTERDFVTTDGQKKYHLTESARRALSARQAWQAGTLTTTSEGGSE
ncbi:PadR family transcriptional regulator [Halorubrum sp. BOL3-1]|uniref:PadR family transcriptional regulator n=1 Tax=Halorubrum sp. BOL3-1 TaxID=2497325 RepID=UPI0010050253|nr:PadR family transcriptional regulator [Halorubrum sp. BOL3-1]QAU12198.1 PadR family transcriptional regulator [Halorubrum sp. BOL3-1]